MLGRDHRYHSDTFMRLTGAAFLARGFKVYWFKDFLNHTPLVPYGVKKLGAACGVMITASHVPPSLPSFLIVESSNGQWIQSVCVTFESGRLIEDTGKMAVKYCHHMTLESKTP